MAERPQPDDNNNAGMDAVLDAENMEAVVHDDDFFLRHAGDDDDGDDDDDGEEEHEAARDMSALARLCRAAYTGDVATVEDLVRHEPSLRGPGALDDAWVDEDGRAAPALVHAASRGRAEGVRALIAAGASVAAVDRDACTALHWAAYTGCDDAAAALLDARADAAAVDRRGRTPLIDACDNGHLAVATRLAAAAPGALNAATNWGYTALRYCAEKGHEAVALMLLEAGADHQAPRNNNNNNNNNADNGNANNNNHGARQMGFGLQAPRQLEPLLVAATRQWRARTFAALLAAGADIAAVDADGCNALHWAAYRGNADAAAMLVERGCPVEARDFRGRTPLVDACDAGAADVVELLLTAGADAGVVTHSGTSALHFAQRCVDPRCVELLLRTLPLSSVSLADARASPAAIAFLVRAGVAIDAVDAAGCSVVHHLARAGAVAALDALVEAAPAPGLSAALLNAPNAAGLTPFAVAVEQGGREMVARLLALGALPDSAEARAAAEAAGLPPLQGSVALASKRSDFPLVETLLAAGADVDGCDQPHRFTGLQWAAYRGRPDTVRALLAAGARVLTRDKLGRTALHDACDGSEGAGVMRALLEAAKAQAAPLSSLPWYEGMRAQMKAAMEAREAAATAQPASFVVLQ